MKILKVIALLMDYPTADLKTHATEIATAIHGAEEIPRLDRAELNLLLAELTEGNLMNVQETYGGLFDRGRYLSLLLFEHVHGESRDRGQAMVDLMALYNKNGFHINVRELPDYIPLYLEYLSQRPEAEAREGLADVSHILGMLSARLQERGSAYHALFGALLKISEVQVDMAELRETASNEVPDNTPEAIDKIWEEEAITFGMADTDEPCPSQQSQRNAPQQTQATAMHWVDNAASQ